jgi:hypothetical protein
MHRLVLMQSSNPLNVVQRQLRPTNTAGELGIGIQTEC